MFRSPVPIPIDSQQMADIAANGSPMLLRSVGRIAGLGHGEQTALANGGIPSWAVGVACLVGGVFLGAYMARRWPAAMQRVVGR